MVDKTEDFDANDSEKPKAARRRRKRKASSSRPVVFVLDDDAGEVQAIQAVLESQGFLCTTYTQPRECLEGVRLKDCDAVLCDLVMPEMDGNQFLMHVKELRPDLPVIVITGYGNIPVAITAMKNGAANFIEKPFDAELIVKAVRSALGDVDKTWSTVPVRLSKMEKLVLRHVLRGNGNRHIAQKIGKSVRTIEDHRSHLMRKMGVDNIVDLVKRSIAVGLDDTRTD